MAEAVLRSKLITLVETICKTTTFKVEVDGNASEWQQQHTGISQGCPSSPHLLLVVMTATLEGEHSKLNHQLCRNRKPGAQFEEVTHADDTVCLSTDSKATNQFVQAV